MEDNKDLVPVNKPTVVNKYHKRTDEQKKADRVLIKDLWVRRYKLKDICDHPNLKHISVSQVRQDLKQVKKVFKSSPTFDKQFTAKRQIALGEEIINEAMIAWEKSKGLKVKTFSKTKTGGQFSGEETGSMEEVSYGDPNYLKVAKDAFAELNKLYGINQAVKTTEVNVNNNNSQVIIGMQIT